MFSLLLRRAHMYLALFLFPWMLMYALSTLAMNHRMPRPTSFVAERDEPYANAVEPGTPPREMEQQILEDFPELTAVDIRACLEFAADRERKLVSIPPV